MPRLPTERDYVTGTVPPEMLGTEADPSVDNSDLPDGVSVSSEAGLTRVRIPAPAVMPPPNRPDSMMPGQPYLNGMQQAAMMGNTGMLNVGPMFPTPQLRFDFALLPDVQCHLVLQGPAHADHLEQLTEYLLVAVRKLREQEQRKTAEAGLLRKRSKKEPEE